MKRNVIIQYRRTARFPGDDLFGGSVRASDAPSSRRSRSSRRPWTFSAPWHPSVYLGLEPDGRVIIIAHRSEMGTGIRTALPMVLADELEADWKRVKIQQAIGDKKYGDQNTDGSNSIRGFFQPMRIAGATARTMLESAAASKWGVPASECKAQNHEVIHAGTNRKLGFGELVSLAATQPVPKKEDLKFKSASDYKYIGKNIPITNLDDIMAGKTTFGMDARRPGMVYASIERSPVLGGTLKSVDDSEAKMVAGVSDVKTIDPFKPPYMFQALGGVAVIANNTWSAMQGRKKLKIEWDLGDNVKLRFHSCTGRRCRKLRGNRARWSGR